MGKKCFRCGGDHEAKDCSLDYWGEKCVLGCDLYHQMKDCPKENMGLAGNQRNQTIHQKWFISVIDPQEGVPLALQEMKRVIDSGK